MSDKLEWKIELLEKESKEQDETIKQNTKDIRDLQSFKDSTVEKLITIFTTINEIKEDSKWMKRTVIGGLITAIIGGIISLIVWLIQN
ncbi:hypothetical protein [Oceanobacillus sp. FSL H7-0719]|uniref:hypothetical protein n=1 Tax=Oceanobacillus sp. FSL H7-0719 TaxID=2954507 RepID=UPI00324EA635